MKDILFKILAFLCTCSGLFVLLFLFWDVFSDGWHRLSLDFFTKFSSRKPEEAGIYSAFIGSIWIVVMTGVIALPLGIATGIYLQEYQKSNWLAALLEINVANLAGVPSIIYGLLGLGLFVRILHMGENILVGSLTLALLVLPIIIVTTRESLKAIPYTIREASFALGATKWQTIWHQVLPPALPGVLTGVILALSRAIGETAPLIVVGALTYVPFAPSSPFDSFTVLPIQIFNWVSRPQNEFLINAAAAIIVLLFLTFFMNAFAIYFRYKYEKKNKW